MKELPRIAFPVKESLWQIACIHDVDRGAARAVLGQPDYTENDSSRTFGGDEDWGGFEFSSGKIGVICLRVAYRDAVVMANVVGKNDVLGAFVRLTALGKVEIYDVAHPA